MATLMDTGYNPNYVEDKNNTIWWSKSNFKNIDVQHNENGESYIIIKGKSDFFIPYNTHEEALQILKKIELNYAVNGDTNFEDVSLSMIYPRTNTSNQDYKKDIINFLSFANEFNKAIGINEQIELEDIVRCDSKSLLYLDRRTNKIEEFSKDVIDYYIEENQDTRLLTFLNSFEKNAIKDQYKITLEELLIDNKELLTTRDACEKVFEKTKTIVDGKEVCDLVKGGNNNIQDYLIEYLYGVDFMLDEEQFKSILFYKKGDFNKINSLLRGIKPDKDYDNPEELEITVKSVLKLYDVINAMPKRSNDLLIRREDSGFMHNIKKDEFNTFPQFVSFTTTDKLSSMKHKNHFIKILDKNESALPVELIARLNGYGTENEIITNPFYYHIKNVNDKNDEEKEINIETTYPISIYDSLLSGLEKYKNLLNKEGLTQKNVELIEMIDKMIDYIKQKEMSSEIEIIKTKQLVYFDDENELKNKNDDKTKMEIAKQKMEYYEELLMNKQQEYVETKKNKTR